jgi:hypothetical protein
MPGKNQDVVLEKDGDQLDWSCDQWTSATNIHRKEEYSRKNEKKEG